MKSAVIAVFLCFISMFAKADAEAFGLQAVRDCIAKIPTVTDWTQHQALTRQCVKSAWLYRHINSISGAALYLEALSTYLPVDGSIEQYKSTNDELSAFYRSHLGPRFTEYGVKYFTAQELIDSLKGISSGMFYRPLLKIDELGLKQAEWIFAELEFRNQATADLANALLDFLLKNSEWSRAATLEGKWPQLGTPLPLVLGTLSHNKLGYYDLSADLKTLSLQKANLSSGVHVLMSGDCHFAVDAIERLSQHADLAQVMSKFGLVLASAGNIDFNEIDNLRKQYPAFEMHPIHKTGEWVKQGYDVLNSPSFDFIKDGLVVYKIPGDGVGIAQEFCKGLQAIGLKQPSSCKTD